MRAGFGTLLAPRPGRRPGLADRPPGTAGWRYRS